MIILEHVDGKVSDLDDETFESFVSAHIQTRPVVVDGYTVWCPPCKIMAPILEELAKDYGKKVVFARLDLDKARKVGIRYKIMNVPTFLIFSPEEKSLTPFKTIIGAVGDKPFRLVLDKLLKENE